MTSTDTLTGERADLMQSLGQQQFFLRFTAANLTDEQARTRSTVSALTVGGIVKHVTAVVASWARFIEGGAELMESAAGDWEAEHRMGEDETLAELLDAYAAATEHLSALVASADLDAGHPLPVAPWFEVGATWSNRRVLLHLIAETAQHAGHADIIRETIDGQKTMG